MATADDAASAGQPMYCAQPELRPDIELVLGVVSTEARSMWHGSVRNSFFKFSELLPSVVMRLVLRGMNASRAVLDEARLRNDTVFLPAPAQLDAGRGPLTSTMLWLRCASFAWPHALFLGKAGERVIVARFDRCGSQPRLCRLYPCASEDDTWLHVPDILSSLRASSLLLSAHYNITDLYYGQRDPNPPWPSLGPP